MATHSSILAWRIPMDRGAWWATVHAVTKSRTLLSDYIYICQSPPSNSSHPFSLYYSYSSTLAVCLKLSPNKKFLKSYNNTFVRVLIL